MPTFITHYSFDPAKYAGEVNKEPSLTVPDMSFTIQELLERFTSIPEIMKQGFYDDDPTFDDGYPLDVDLVDIQENELNATFLQKSIEEQKKTYAEEQAKRSEAGE